MQFGSFSGGARVVTRPADTADGQVTSRPTPAAGGRATVVVIGGGQSGLSAGYHLKRRGFTSALTDPDGARTFVVLDAEPAAGGAWRHRWESLRMNTVNGIFDLPDFPQPPVDPEEPSPYGRCRATSPPSSRRPTCRSCGR